MLRILEPVDDGAREVVRLDTGIANGYAAPSYADGRIFVRNGEQAVAIRVSPGRS